MLTFGVYSTIVCKMERKISAPNKLSTLHHYL